MDVCLREEGIFGFPILVRFPDRLFDFRGIINSLDRMDPGSFCFFLFLVLNDGRFIRSSLLDRECTSTSISRRSSSLRPRSAGENPSFASFEASLPSMSPIKSIGSSSLVIFAMSALPSLMHSDERHSQLSCWKPGIGDSTDSFSSVTWRSSFHLSR